ncbi:MAG: hypothetical protein IIA67_13670 [Planctomycetes bacterium]|nr:hypothetical protein [Planctomycetota bacterium]
MIAGETQSFGAGGRDFWLIKIDAFGNQLWTRTFGGPADDVAYAIALTSDGGLVVAGSSAQDSGSKTDFLLIKTDSLGIQQWSQRYANLGLPGILDSESDDIAYAVRQTDDGGYIIAGSTDGQNGQDAWLVKTDANGVLDWAKEFGASGSETAFSVQQTDDGGYVLAGSTDSIDLDAARELGVVVSNIPGKTAPVVAEHAFALLWAAAKRLSFQTAEMKAGRWTLKTNTTLAGKTLGVVGTGAIGAAMARLAGAVGMNVIAWTFTPSDGRAAALGVRFVSLEELLRTSAAVGLHVRGSNESRHLIGARELAMMKPGALLINTSRGVVVDTAALIDALESGHLGGAGLDVFEDEPLPQGHPILGCGQVVLTPHHADQTPEGIDLLNQGAVENVLAYLDGKPQNVVT